MSLRAAADRLVLGGCGRGDVGALLTLLGTALVVAWPILAGGYETYVDNPVHLAELSELAAGHGNWSEAGFAGFPLSTLHSPLWYPAIGWLVRIGLPLEPLYVTAVFAGFMAPALAIYAVARVHARPVAAGLIGILLLVQSPAVWGIGSALAGMWTHSLAAGGFILFARLVTRPETTWRSALGLSVVLAVVALTHLFALVVSVVFVLIVHLRAYAARQLTRPEVIRRATAFGVAAFAAAPYWLTFWMQARPEVAPLDQLSLTSLGCRLLFPCDAMYLVDGRPEEALRTGAYLLDAAPLFALLGLGVWGSRAKEDDAGLSHSAGRLAVLIGAALALHALTPVPLLGPVSWRFLFWVRIALALAALPVLGRVESWAPLRRPWAPRVLAAASLALGLIWRIPLVEDSPPQLRAELRELAALWDWLGKNSDPDWGRIFLHDTFGQRWEDRGLSFSHVLARTIEHTGQPQIGTYYGVVPFSTRWTLSEFNLVFGGRWMPKEGLAVAMGKVNAGAFVASSADAAAWIRQMGLFDPLYADGRYSVWRLKSARNEWVAPLRPGNVVRNVRFQPGRVQFEFETDARRTRVVPKVAWHPWWRLEGIEGAVLAESPDGFLVVDNIPRGRYTVRLTFEPNPWPGRLGWLGWILLVAWGLALRLPFAARSVAAASGSE